MHGIPPLVWQPRVLGKESMLRQASEGELVALRRPEDDWVVLKQIDVRCDGVPETVGLSDCGCAPGY